MTEAAWPRRKAARLLLAALLGAALPAIAGATPPEEPESQPAAPADPAVRQLIDRTLRELVFVPGGTFWMGDYVHGKYDSAAEQAANLL